MQDFFLKGGIFKLDAGCDAMAQPTLKKSRGGGGGGGGGTSLRHLFSPSPSSKTVVTLFSSSKYQNHFQTQKKHTYNGVNTDLPGGCPFCVPPSIHQ